MSSWDYNLTRGSRANVKIKVKNEKRNSKMGVKNIGT